MSYGRCVNTLRLAQPALSTLLGIATGDPAPQAGCICRDDPATGCESADVESEWLFERSVSVPGLHVLDLGLSESTSQAANGTVTFGCLYSTYEPVA